MSTRPGNAHNNLYLTDKMSRTNRTAMVSQSMDVSTLAPEMQSSNASPTNLVSRSLNLGKKGIRATKRSELFPQAMTKQEKKDIIMRELAENQFIRTFRSKQSKIKQCKVPISPDRFIRND